MPVKKDLSGLPVVLLHGLFSTPQEFGLIALPLRSRGVTLATPDIAGYTMAGRGTRSRWQDWAEAARAAVAKAVPRGQPFVLGGLCAGGLLAASLTLQGQPDVAGLVMLSPTFHYDGWGLSGWRHWRRLGYALGLDRWITVAEREPYGIKNAKIRKWVARDMAERAASAAGPASLPLWAIREVERLTAELRAQLPRLHTPTLVMHARDDEISSLAGVHDAMARMATPDKRLVVLENSYHMVTIDNDRHRVVAELLALCRPPRPAIATAASAADVRTPCDLVEAA